MRASGQEASSVGGRKGQHLVQVWTRGGGLGPGGAQMGPQYQRNNRAPQVALCAGPQPPLDLWVGPVVMVTTVGTRLIREGDPPCAFSSANPSESSLAPLPSIPDILAPAGKNRPIKDGEMQMAAPPSAPDLSRKLLHLPPQIWAVAGTILSGRRRSQSPVPIEVENPFPDWAVVSLWRMNINCINFQ